MSPSLMEEKIQEPRSKTLQLVLSEILQLKAINSSVL